MMPREHTQHRSWFRGGNKFWNVEVTTKRFRSDSVAAAVFRITSSDCMSSENEQSAIARSGAQKVAAFQRLYLTRGGEPVGYRCLVRLRLMSQVFRTGRATMQHLSASEDVVVCGCLSVTKGEIHSAIAVSDTPSLRAVMRLTCAGTGCTACHRMIRQMVADQCPAAASSPTCVSR